METAWPSFDNFLIYHSCCYPSLFWVNNNYEDNKFQLLHYLLDLYGNSYNTVSDLLSCQQQHISYQKGLTFSEDISWEQFIKEYELYISVSEYHYMCLGREQIKRKLGDEAFEAIQQKLSEYTFEGDTYVMTQVDNAAIFCLPHDKPVMSYIRRKEAPIERKLQRLLNKMVKKATIRITVFQKNRDPKDAIIFKLPLDLPGIVPYVPPCSAPILERTIRESVTTFDSKLLSENTELVESPQLPSGFIEAFKWYYSSKKMRLEKYYNAFCKTKNMEEYYPLKTISDMENTGVCAPAKLKEDYARNIDILDKNIEFLNQYSMKYWKGDKNDRGQ